MATELISFRLSNTELDWLREQCQLGESLNLAAKRLLLSLSQGVNSSVDSVDSSVDSVDSEELEEIENRLLDQLEKVEDCLDKRFEEVEERLKKLKA